MICPACGTWNRETARFCKHCAARLEPATPPSAGPAAPTPASGALPPPPASRPRAWWHPLGVTALVATCVGFVDAAPDARLSWSLVAVPGLGFLAGGLLILQFLASPGRADRRPFFAGSALLVAALFLLPVAVAVQGRATTAEAVEVAYDPAVRFVNLYVFADPGDVSVRFEDAPPYIVRAEIVHVGGVFSSHYDGDVVATNGTTGDTLAFRVSVRGLPGLFFVGGHEVRVSVHRNVSASVALESTAGSLSLDVPAGVEVRGIDATVTTTGNVALTVRHAAWANGATVRLSSATGSVTLDLVQEASGAGSVSVGATSTTGRVVVRFAPDGGVGAEVSTSAPPGAIGFDSAKYEEVAGLLYAPSRTGFEAANLKFIVQLATTTGSVVVA